MTLINYLKQRFPANFAIMQESNGIITIRDKHAEKGKGYRISITEENRYIEGLLEFEDYARELSEYARARLSETDSAIKTLMERHPHFYASINKHAVEQLFAPETRKENGWSLKTGYRKNDAWPVENFTDLLLSFILFLFPYDHTAEEEGIPHEVLAVGYERSFHNRSICIAFHGYQCKACGQSMREIYGDVARSFIHVHHLSPLASTGQHTPDPFRDMVPLCPNCHSVAHLRNPPYTVEEIQKMLNRHHERI